VAQQAERAGLTHTMSLLPLHFKLFWFLFVPISLVSFFTGCRLVPPSLIPGEPDATDTAAWPRRILLLTAHPDDECMFFGPTLLALKEHPKAEVYSLCLSIGDADGLGDVRRTEFGLSLDVLGIPEGRRWILDKVELRDNFTAEWDPQVIADTVRPYVLANDIDVILTFDHLGVSSHPNHKSIPKGAARLISSFPRSPDAYTGAPRLFSLITMPVLWKYSGPLLSRFTLFKSLWKMVLGRFIGLEATDILKGSKGTAVFVSGIQEYITAVYAMLQHSSQLVWFRFLYIEFSQYMWVNEWVEVIPANSTTTSTPTFTMSM